MTNTIVDHNTDNFMELVKIYLTFLSKNEFAGISSQAT